MKFVSKNKFLFLLAASNMLVPGIANEADKATTDNSNKNAIQKIMDMHRGMGLSEEQMRNLEQHLRKDEGQDDLEDLSVEHGRRAKQSFGRMNKRHGEGGRNGVRGGGNGGRGGGNGGGWNGGNGGGG